MSASVFKDVVRKKRRAALRAISYFSAAPLEKGIRSLTVIAPHPDDEILGCAGMIGQTIANGGEVSIVYLSTGSGAHRRCCGEPEHNVAAARQQLAIKSTGILGIKPERCIFLDGNDGELPMRGNKGFSEFSGRLYIELRALKPEAVFCPHLFEGWSDHVAAADLAEAVVGRLENRPRLYHYCVWFWYSMPLKQAWHVNWRHASLLDIGEYFSLKKKAMRIYLDALAPCGNPWVGKLPKEFLAAFKWDKELFFEAEY